MKWIEQGEKPTKYFCNLEKANYKKKTGPRGEEINPAQVNKEIEAFYRNMYTAKINDNMNNQEKFNEFEHSST